MTSDNELDNIWLRHDDLYHAGEFDKVDVELIEYIAAMKWTDMTALICVATSTAIVKSKLKYRQKFMVALRQHCEAVYDGDVDSLLMGLEK